MVINIILGIWCFILSFKVINLSDRLKDTISRNIVQHDIIEKELHYIHKRYMKLHLSSAYGKMAEMEDAYIENDIQAIKEAYKSNNRKEGNV